MITPADCRNGTYPFSYHHQDSCPIHPECPLQHSVKVDGVWQFAPGIELGQTHKINGTTSHKIRCIGCGHTNPIKQHDANILQSRGYTIAFTILPTGIDGSVCQVAGCGRTDTELHHFAPRSLFPDADNWPVLPLCVEHHLAWHNTTGVAT